MCLKKRISLISAITVLLLGLAFCMSNTVFAEDVIDNGSCGKNVSWKLTGTTTDLTLTISGTGRMNDFPETEIPWGRKSDIKTIIVKEGVTYIGRNAFYSLENAQTVSLPSTLTGIGYRSFGNCSSLGEIVIPGSVTSIGELAFYGCSSVTSINIPDRVASIAGHTFEG